ncbi:MAG: hypothetical protein IIV47_02990, partial [Clostridia bacterium]|nr:hypothetical protein [Clostridia bacterium]
MKQADNLKEIISLFSARKNQMNGIELYELNSKITILREMERDTRIIGKQLTEYYSQHITRKVYHSH